MSDNKKKDGSEEDVSVYKKEKVEGTTDSVETEGKGKKKGGVKGLLFLLLLVGALIIGGIFFKKISTEKKADNFLAEATSFIEERNFSRAEESLKLAEETLPGRTETADVEGLLQNEREIDRLEKELSVSTTERNWDASDTLLVSLREIDPENAQLSLAEGEIKQGRLDDKRRELEQKLTVARKSDDLPGVVKISDELIALDPTHANAGSWKSARQAAVSEIEERNQKAAALYEKAQPLDLGEYNAELLQLATEAKDLSPEQKYQDFFNRVNDYPREILFPEEYETLQEAVNAARPIDVIKVTPGEYTGSVVVNKKVKITGEEGKNVIFQCEGKEAAALFVGPKGDLTASYLMFRHSGEEESSDSAFSSVMVSGKASFTACLFFNALGHGLHVVDGGAANLLSCRAEANSWDGIGVSGKGSKATLDNTITTKNGHNGLDVWEGASLTVKSSFSEGNKRSGAAVASSGSLNLTETILSDNQHSGLYVMKQGTADVSTSTLKGNQLAGAFGDASGAVKISDSEVTGNHIAGIVLTKGTSWSGLDTVTFKENHGEEVWKEAEFESLEDVKAAVVQKEEAPAEGEAAAEGEKKEEPEAAPATE